MNALSCNASIALMYCTFILHIVGYWTYSWLDSFYCGCNRRTRARIQEARPDAEERRQRLEDASSPKRRQGTPTHASSPHRLTTSRSKRYTAVATAHEHLAFQSRKIYADRFATFLSFFGWVWVRDNLIAWLVKKCCSKDNIQNCCKFHVEALKTKHIDRELRRRDEDDYTPRQRWISKIIQEKNNRQTACCYRIMKYTRKCCCVDDKDETSVLTAYHKGCYNCTVMLTKSMHILMGVS